MLPGKFVTDCASAIDNLLTFKRVSISAVAMTELLSFETCSMLK